MVLSEDDSSAEVLLVVKYAIHIVLYLQVGSVTVAPHVMLYCYIPHK